MARRAARVDRRGPRQHVDPRRPRPLARLRPRHGPVVAVNFAGEHRPRSVRAPLVRADEQHVGQLRLARRRTATNFGAGKGIDLRDGSIDSLMMRNNTFVNYTDRIIRHRDSTGPIENFVFDHNTILNAVSYHGTLALGQVGRVGPDHEQPVLRLVRGRRRLQRHRPPGGVQRVRRALRQRASRRCTWISRSPPTASPPNWTVDNNVYVVTRRRWSSSTPRSATGSATTATRTTGPTATTTSSGRARR